MLNDSKSIEFSSALVALLKGVVNREGQTKQWNTIVTQTANIEDYMSKIGLTLMLDQTDGYAYLKQQEFTEETAEIPRVVPRHQLSYPVSLLLVLLRKQLLEFDTQSGDDRNIISKQDIIEKMRPYLKDTTNEVKQIKEIESNIKRIEEMGFIRALKGSEPQYEVLRIIRSFVDAGWLSEMDSRLNAYREYQLGAAEELDDKV